MKINFLFLVPENIMYEGLKMKITQKNIEFEFLSSCPPTCGIALLLFFFKDNIQQTWLNPETTKWYNLHPLEKYS